MLISLARILLAVLQKKSLGLSAEQTSDPERKIPKGRSRFEKRRESLAYRSFYLFSSTIS